MAKATGSPRARTTSAAAKKVATPSGDALLPRESVEGYRAFRAFRFPDERRRFLKLAKRQSPNILMIGCVDSRVPLEIIFDVDPGDIFVVRNIAALVPPDTPNALSGTSAAVQYAVKKLEVSHIVVVGHAKCGGVRACAERKRTNGPDPSPDDYVGRWVDLIGPVADTLDPPPEKLGPEFDAYCEGLCQESVKNTLTTLRLYPWVDEKEKRGELSLHGAYFSIEEGELFALDTDSGSFVPVLPRDAVASV